MKKAKVRDPLGPLDAVTGIFAGLLLTGLAFAGIAGIAALFNDDISVMGIGENRICVETNQFSYGEMQPIDDLDRQDVGIRKNVKIDSGDTSVCDVKPGATQQALNGLTQIPTFTVFLGFILLTRRTIRHAQKHGLFSATLAARIERLGWLLLFGLVGAALIEWLAEGQLLLGMLRDAGWASGSFGVSVPGIIGAFGLVSIGRIMSHAAALQADADATI